jgi:predicted transcriptional regulator
MINEIQDPGLNLRIAPLGIFDIKSRSKALLDLERLISEHKEFYPDIMKWFSGKVLPGIEKGQRVAYVGYNNNQAVASAILKNGKQAKFCHLSIKNDYRNMHMGEVFFSIMALDVRSEAEEIHFTLPESLWQSKNDFFTSFGFSHARRAYQQYRLFDEEYTTSASFQEVWSSVLLRIPKIINIISPSEESLFNGVVLSVRPEYADLIMNHEKTVEVRRVFNPELAGKKMVLYSSHPQRTLRGYATIDQVVEGSAEEIWERYGVKIGCSKEELLHYSKGRERLCAILLKDVTPYRNEIYLDQFARLLAKEPHPPQSYLLINNNQAWKQAISIVELLHRRFFNTTMMGRERVTDSI